MKHNKIYILLIIINLFWSASAFVYDFNKIIALPIYTWPFIIICPIYPLLLAISWISIYLSRPSKKLITFTAINSSMFFIAALIYYPVWMKLNGFDWLAFGQIFWVAFYGLQGVYLIHNIRPDRVVVFISFVFLLLTFLVQYWTKSKGFFDTANFSQTLILILYGVLAIVSAGLCGVLLAQKQD